MVTARPVLRGFHFTEAPRWHEGALWFSDIHGRTVQCVEVAGDAASGAADTVVTLPGDRPSGLGWLPDGRMLLVAMGSRRLLRRGHDGTLVEHADLSGLARGSVNDMIVAADGTAYVGDMGVALFTDGPREREPGQVLLVTPEGDASVVADDLALPNGIVLGDDGRTLVVAESGGRCLTAFTVAADRSLGGRRTFASLEPAPDRPTAAPDGACLDAEGAVWFADASGRRAVRVLDGGEVTDVVECEDGAGVYACVLGGADRRTLLLCVAATADHRAAARDSTSRIDAVRVAVPGAGRP